MTRLAYVHRSRIGTFSIERRPNGQWSCFVSGDDITGPMMSADHVLEEVCGGHCEWPQGVDPSTLGLSDDLSDWELVRS